MAFKNEYIPPLEDETSEFLKQARVKLNTGFGKFDSWTVDRENNMVLLHGGSGHDMDSYNYDFWLFIDRRGRYRLITVLLSKTNLSPDEIAITRKFNYTEGVNVDVPDEQSISHIKEALRESSRQHIFNLEAFKRSHLTLIDAHTGKEI